jgi:hypothetical protein
MAIVSVPLQNPAENRPFPAEIVTGTTIAFVQDIPPSKES